MSKLPWKERVTMLSINPDAATREDVAKMAAELSESWNRRPAPSVERDEMIEELAVICDRKAEKHRQIMKRHKTGGKVWHAQLTTVRTANELAEEFRTLKSEGDK